MSLAIIAKFLDEHPEWSPSFFTNNRGRTYIDGFLNSTGRYVSLTDVETMLATVGDEGYDCA